MKQVLFFALAVALFTASCNSKPSKEASVTESPEPATSTPAKVVETAPAPQPQMQDDMAQMAANLKNALRYDLLKNDYDALTPEQRKFALERYDLNGDGKFEYLVGFVANSYFCGSGGCTYYLLDHESNTISRFTVADGPFIVLNEKHNGWHDLVVRSGENLHHLIFNGKKYPNNPSTAPVYKMIPGDGLPRLIDPNLPMPMYEF